MPAIVRVGDSHACGSTNVGGSPNVFVNGKKVHRIGDSDAHGGTQVGGSSNVFTNGIGVARIGDVHSGDPLDHSPSPEASGSPDVFVN